ncbi:MAG: hypothetical protein WEA56_10810 [Balneolaceae bacterium]
MIRKKKEDLDILDLATWEKSAGPVKKKQWKKHRSAKEVAKAWLNGNNPDIPVEIKSVIEGHEDFSDITSWIAEPEYKSHFDSYDGPANLDMIVEPVDGNGKYLIGIEAKADETFGVYIKDKFTGALEIFIDNPNSRQIDRIKALAGSLFKKNTSLPKVTDLRYQLLTGLAGTLSEAINQKVTRCIFLIHEFNTPSTKKNKRDQNQADLNDFVYRLSNGEYKIVEEGKLYGPILLHGKPLFSKAPPLYIGKAVRTVH